MTCAICSRKSLLPFCHVCGNKSDKEVCDKCNRSYLKVIGVTFKTEEEIKFFMEYEDLDRPTIKKLAREFSGV